jgi:hypothetical protein
MKQFDKYDPEDIESLLLNKQFAELYPEEKEFVLRHISDEEQYNSMRKMLMEIREISQSDDLLTPDASIKKNLMAQFESDRKSRFTIWLNSLFAAPDLPWFRQRGFQMAFGIGLVLIGVWGILQWNNADAPVALAEVRKEESKADTTATPSEAIKTAENEQHEINVDTSSKNLLPQKPVELAMNESNQVLTVREESVQDAPASMTEEADMNAPMTNDDSKLAKAESTSAGSTFSNTENLGAVAVESKRISSIKGVASADAILDAPSLQDYKDVIDVLFTAR